MSTLNQLRHGLERAWDSLAEGWRQLLDHASDALTRFTPVRHAQELETADELIAGRASRWGLLAAQVQETDEAVVVRLEAPGLEPEAFDISVVDDYLVVQGEKRVQRESREGRYTLMECAYGRFERAIPLPVPVDEDAARASYRHGVLRIELPRLRAAGARRIQVDVD